MQQLNDVRVCDHDALTVEMWCIYIYIYIHIHIYINTYVYIMWYIHIYVCVYTTFTLSTHLLIGTLDVSMF